MFIQQKILKKIQNLYFEEWDDGFISEVRFANPILDNEQIREMTRERANLN